MSRIPFEQSFLAYAKRGCLAIGLSAVAIATITIQPAPAAITVDNKDVQETIRKIKAGQFLSQATLGASPKEISDLAEEIRKHGATKAFNNWLDKEFEKDYESIAGFADKVIKAEGLTNTSARRSKGKGGLQLNSEITNYQTFAWWDRAYRANDRLRQRVAWGLIQIFVTSGNVDGGRLSARWRQPLSYYDVLLENAFTDYRSLIGDVTYHPFMGFYLSHLKNDKGDPANGVFPDENYAREILQLFSLGVYKMEDNGEFVLDRNNRPVELYDNATIREYAKVFTGLSYKPKKHLGIDSFLYNSRNYTGPMVMYDKHHDKSEKKLLHGTLKANQHGDDDISQALNGIANHSNVPPFLSRLLIQRFTSSNPSGKYIEAVAAAWKKDPKTGKRGQMKAILREIFMNPEARNSLSITTKKLTGGKTKIVVTPKDPFHGRVKEPILMMTQYLRRYFPESSEQYGMFKPMAMSAYVSQVPLNAPHVFNFYSADFQPGSGPLFDKIVKRGENLVSPESQIIPTNTIRLFETFRYFTSRGSIQQNSLSTTKDAEMKRIAKIKENEPDMQWLINDLNINLCYGTMPEPLQEKIAEAMEDDGKYDERFNRVLAIVLSSADFAVSY